MYVSPVMIVVGALTVTDVVALIVMPVAIVLVPQSVPIFTVLAPSEASVPPLIQTSPP